MRQTLSPDLHAGALVGLHKGSQSIVDPKLPSVPLSARWQAPRSFKRSRCLIPISGYYEWQNTPSGKQPWFSGADWLRLAAADANCTRHR